MGYEGGGLKVGSRPVKSLRLYAVFWDPASVLVAVHVHVHVPCTCIGTR